MTRLTLYEFRNPLLCKLQFEYKMKICKTDTSFSERWKMLFSYFMEMKYQLLLVFVYIGNGSFKAEGNERKALDISSVCMVNRVDHKTYTIGHETTYVMWKGDPLSECRIYFKPSSTNMKVCTSVVENRLQSTNARVLLLRRYQGFDFIFKAIRRNDVPDVPYCGQYGFAVAIQITSQNSKETNNSVILKIYTEQRQQGIIFMIVTATVFTLNLFIAITCFASYKNKGREDDIESDSQVITSISQTGDSQVDVDSRSVLTPPPT